MLSASRPAFSAKLVLATMMLAAMSVSVLAQDAPAPAPAQTEDLVVKYDQSQLLRLSRPATEIIIGNPAIADISVQAGNLLVITGKTFGITNIIALDAERNIIQEQRVLVRRDEAKVVNLQRGTQRQSYNCTPQCNPSITIGDEQAYFDSISKASQNKIGFSERAADSNAPNNNQ
jgi:Flp pilus assembly secretin CpaC